MTLLAPASPDLTLPVPEPARWLPVAAVAPLGAGAVHAAAVGAHGDTRQALLVFAALALAQLVWGPLDLARPSEPVVLSGLALAAAAVVGWVAAKAGGRPGADVLQVDPARAVRRQQDVAGVDVAVQRPSRPGQRAGHELGGAGVQHGVVVRRGDGCAGRGQVAGDADLPAQPGQRAAAQHGPDGDDAGEDGAEPDADAVALRHHDRVVRGQAEGAGAGDRGGDRLRRRRDR